MRWTTPSVYKRRTASRDTELAGVPIRAGDKITVSEMSANRDELVFAEPFRFDVGRLPNPHLGFGFGVHYCLGGQPGPARTEGRAGGAAPPLRRLREHGAREWTPNNRLFGLKHLPVVSIPRAEPAR